MQAVNAALQRRLWRGTASAPAAPAPPVTDAATRARPTGSTAAPAPRDAPQTSNATPPSPAAQSDTALGTDDSEARSKSGSSSVGPAVGGAVGGVAALLAIAVLSALLVVRARRRKAARLPDTIATAADKPSSAANANMQVLPKLPPPRTESSAREATPPAPNGPRLTDTLSSGGRSDCAHHPLLVGSLSAMSTAPGGHGGASAAMMTRRRIAPANSTLAGSTVSGFSGAVYSQPNTLEQPQERDRLRTALLNMAEAEPPQLFAGRYRLKAEWVQGGQALVVFARDDADGFFQYAIKCALHSFGP